MIPTRFFREVQANAFGKQIVDEVDTLKKESSRMRILKERLAKEYENENAEQLFVDDMTRIYESAWNI